MNTEFMGKMLINLKEQLNQIYEEKESFAAEEKEFFEHKIKSIKSNIHFLEKTIDGQYRATYYTY